MLFGSFDLLLDDPAGFIRLAVLVVFSLVMAITVHEFSHALVATGLGDNTARSQGRFSLNPIRHLDPGGAVMMLLAGFGWGKPVPIDPHRLAHGLTGTALVAAAGPLSNVMVAFLLAIPIKLGVLTCNPLAVNRVARVMTGGLREGLGDIVCLVIFFNLLLAVFNLIPLSPLDGSRVLARVIPADHAPAYARLQRHGPIILVALIMFDFFFHLGFFWRVIGPVVRGLSSLATG